MLFRKIFRLFSFDFFLSRLPSFRFRGSIVLHRNGVEWKEIYTNLLNKDAETHLIRKFLHQNQKNSKENRNAANKNNAF